MFRFVGPPVKIEPLERKNVDGKRHYVVGDEYYPSVTSVTGSIPGKQEGLAKWRKRIGEKEANKISVSDRPFHTIALPANSTSFLRAK